MQTIFFSRNNEKCSKWSRTDPSKHKCITSIVICRFKRAPGIFQRAKNGFDFHVLTSRLESRIQLMRENPFFESMASLKTELGVEFSSAIVLASSEERRGMGVSLLTSSAIFCRSPGHTGQCCPIQFAGNLLPDAKRNRAR